MAVWREVAGIGRAKTKRKAFNLYSQFYKEWGQRPGEGATIGVIKKKKVEDGSGGFTKCAPKTSVEVRSG